MGYDFFLSYARADNRPPDPTNPASVGWVTRFREALIVELESKLRRQVRYFWDDDDVDGNEALTPRIETALEESRVYVAISTGTYYERPWCNLEREKILKILGSNAAATKRLFIIHRADPSAETPEWQDKFCDDIRGYHFFRGKKRLGWPSLVEGTPEHTEYFVELQNLAADMAKQIKTMEAMETVSDLQSVTAAEREIVYLAETATESYEDRERLRIALAHDYEVRPAGLGRKPEPVYRAAITEAMRSAIAFVQVIGPAPHELPGSAKSCDEIQWELAKGLRAFRWRAPDLVVDGSLFAAHREFAAASDIREGLLATFESDLLKELRPVAASRKLARGAGGLDRMVLVAAIKEDERRYGAFISNCLKRYQLGCHFTKEPAEEIMAENVRGLLVLYGRSEREWVGKRTSFLRKLRATRLEKLLVGVFHCEPPPDMGERYLIYRKEDFQEIHWDKPAELEQFAEGIPK